MTVGGSKGSGRRGAAVSMAIALSSGPIRGIGRIWADGREIRDASGRFETATKMRVYTGGGRQEPDPLIVAAEGIGRAPAYRGRAYVVFEDLPLGSFGNRIPNLSFEVDADSGEPAAWLGALLAEADLETADSDRPADAVGYGATGAILADDVEILARVAAAEVSYPQGALRFEWESRLFEVPLEELGAPAGSQQVKSSRARAEGLRPGSLSIDYLDPERDYQAGRQRVDRSRTGEAAVASAPLVATATQARFLAQRWLRTAENAVDTVELTLGWRWLQASVGDVIALSARPERWRVVRRNVQGLLVQLEASLVPDGVFTRSDSDPGRALPAPVAVASATRLMLFETPVPVQPGPAALWIAANGDPGWRSASVVRLDAGTSVFIGDLAGANPNGVLASPLEAGCEDVWDEANVLYIQMQAGTVPFESRPDEAVLAGANLLRVGNELLQFRDALQVSDDVVRLGGLLRGRFGTGFSGLRHDTGSRVELIRTDRILSSAIQLDSLGSRQTFLAEGRGDPPGGVETSIVVQGLGLGPLAPCHVRAERGVAGSIHTSWIPRGRTTFEWGNAEPEPTGFRWRYLGPEGLLLERDILAQAFDLSVAEQEAVFGSVLPAGTIEVEAIGDGPRALRVSAPVLI